jgi:hypothetical protein
MNILHVLFTLNAKFALYGFGGVVGLTVCDDDDDEMIHVRGEFVF